MPGEPIVIMLIEDNVDHAELVIRSMQEHRIANQVRHLQDAASALDYLFHRGEFSDPERSPRPDVILLDLRLPGVDGIDLLKVIKADHDLRAIPVIVLSTSDAEKDVARAYEHRANSYLVKPAGYEEFKKLIQNLGFYWLGWNSHPDAKQ